MKKLYFLTVLFCVFTAAKAQIINFPDANFKAKLLSANPSLYIASTDTPVYNPSDGSATVTYFNTIDTNSDGEIQVSEAQNIKFLWVSYSNINDLSGIEYFSNLQVLFCHSNQLSTLNLSQNTALVKINCGQNQLTSLNVSQNLSLAYLECDVNQLTALDVSQNTSLVRLVCHINQLSSLNASQNVLLKFLACSENPIASLDVSQNVLLEDLFCDDGQLTSLDVSNNPSLLYLGCSSNQLSSLDLSQNTVLKNLYCNNNQITNLDLSYSQEYTSIDCSNNNLTSLNVKNGIHYIDLAEEISYLNFSGNPNLNYICADEIELDDIQNLINDYGYTNCNINTYCSFTPGGEFYTIQGNNKYDNNSNGCDSSDLGYPNLRFNISNGTTTGSLISNTSGIYSIPVQVGIHTLTPVLESPTYFTISPANVNVTFPTQSSPFTQNFCITANGVHPDLEVILVPTAPARPGFDAVYKVIYKNKGTNTQSGTVTLTYDDTVLDFVSATPTVTNQTISNLFWDFTNLLPFETREIVFTLNVNSPIETPAVNGGDVLSYTAAITSVATDETPNDNTFVLNQTVVNSNDPNDKTCLEGITIVSSEVGKYVHYMIRFENTGTFPAENIVVKDMIDTAKFDINSLVPIKGSHDYFTRIDGNKVEFIFENINLPFDDANNDGYVAFKIKTKPTLVAGNAFSNSASIYFDYNFPIVTNTAVTTIQALSTQDFAFGTYFTVYPNPVSNVLNIETKQTIEVSSVSIYNQLGQLVLVIPNAQNTKSVDVSSLSSGNYFIKINSDKGTSNAKFNKK